MTTTPAATPAVQEPRVSDGMLARLVFDAEAENWSPSSAWYWPRMLALDLRDSRALAQSQAEELAAKEAENEQLRQQLGLQDIGVDGLKLLQNSYKTACERLAATKAALKAAREAFDTVTPIPSEPNCFSSTNALDNLEGAIIDLERQNADAVCIRTLKRIAEQLQQIESALTPKEPTP